MRTKTFLAAVMLLFFFATSNAQQANKKASSLNGAWESDDKKEFTMIYDGYFNSLDQDSTGRWAVVHAGTYTLNGDNTITFKVLYSSDPEHIGSLNTAEYSLNGETMKIHHFKKLVNAEGKDITDQAPRAFTETMTRMK